MKKKGFSLVELIVVMMIMAIVVSVALPLGSLMVKRAADKATREEIENISSALTRYYKDNDEFPASPVLENVGSYISSFGDAYLRDGWGEDYECSCSYGSWGNDSCELKSKGPNKNWDECENLEISVPGEDDICFTVEAPKMIKREKIEKVRSELAVIGLAAESYTTLEGSYPSDINALFSAGYLSDESFRTDLWGTVYVKYPTENKFCSCGPNRIWGGGDDICP